MSYDSAPDTKAHIQQVRDNLQTFCLLLEARGVIHDASKLEEPEKSAFDNPPAKLHDLTYGSAEYEANQQALKVALDHHYAHNRHHPEHWFHGVNDMTLVDIVEMFCDWAAAVKRHSTGDLAVSIQTNRERFGLSDQLASIFENTRKELGW